MTGSTRYEVVDRASGDVIATVTRVDAAGEAQPLTDEEILRALHPDLDADSVEIRALAARE